MSSPVEAPRQHVEGHAEVSFRHADGRTRLVTLSHHDPLRMLLPATHDGVPVAVLVNTGGGLVGGDLLDVRARCEANAGAWVTSQAAEKVYRSSGPDTRVNVTLSCAAGGWLEWLPHETILFDGARLRRTLRIDAHPEARVIAGELVVFGRTARGERLTTGLLHDRWEVCTGSRLRWADAVHLDGDLSELLSAPAGFAGAVASATCVCVVPDAQQRLEPVRGLLEGLPGRAGATCVDGVLVVRWLCDDAEAMRRAWGTLRASIRSCAAGLDPVLPRQWHL